MPESNVVVLAFSSSCVAAASSIELHPTVNNTTKRRPRERASMKRRSSKQTFQDQQFAAPTSMYIFVSMMR